MTIRITHPNQDRPKLYKLLNDREHKGKKLNLGCGFHHIKDVYNIDNSPDCEPDYLIDIEKVPWRLEAENNICWGDNTFDYICSLNTLEHIDNLLGVMGEIWRVCKPGATVEIIVPNCLHQAAFEDPTHVRFFGASSFQYWDADTYTGSSNTSWYTSDRFNFKKEKVITIVDDFFDTDQAMLEGLFRVQDKLGELLHRIYQYYCIGVVHYLMFILKVVKPIPKQREATINIYE